MRTTAGLLEESAMNVETRHVKYAFADVVNFTQDRTVEAQVEIIDAMNEAVRKAIEKLEVICLPTGDGVCVGIVDPSAPADAHLKVALSVLECMYEWASSAHDLNRRCKLRFGINESVDVLITDINGHQNLAGAGINQAQRLMSMADGNQIVAGRAAFDTLDVRDAYMNSFRVLQAETKHGEILTGYQFIGLNAPFLDLEVPAVVRDSEPINIELNAKLKESANCNTNGMVRCIDDAVQRRIQEMESIIREVTKPCTEEQKLALERVQVAWMEYWEKESEFRGALRRTTHATMYRIFGASMRLHQITERVKSLRQYAANWLDLPIDKHR